MIPLLLAACSDCPSLPETPITGADPETHDLIQSVLAEMDATLRLPVCIRKVRFMEESAYEAGKAGRYGIASHVIRLWTVPGFSTNIGVALRHEVCHGVAHQNDVVDGREELFQGGEVSGEDPLPPGHEPFARLCESGAGAFSAFDDQVCPDDPDMDGYFVVRDEVYETPSDPEPPLVLGPPVSFDLATWTAGEPLTQVEFYESVGGHLILYYDPDKGLAYEPLTIDPWTGERIGDEDLVELETESDARMNLPGDWWGSQWAPLADGSLVVQAGVNLLNPNVIHRWLRLKDGVLFPVEDACGDHGTLFSLGGSAWVGRFEGTVVTWQPWLPGDSTP